jgi:acetate kinase
MPSEVKFCSGIVERIGIGDSFIRHRVHDTEIDYAYECKTHDAAIRLIFNFLTNSEYGVIKDLREIEAIGHRVVHGGQKFTRSTIINDDVIKVIEDCSVLAPLHNPANLLGIRAAMNLIPNIPHVAIFDTAFFTTIPTHAYMYAIPYQWYEKYGIRKYGFHGSSHLYVSRRAAELLGKKPSEINVITVHIGNGVSITAVKKGLAYDHSMGFTPLEGAVMGTRCGDLDVGVVLYVMEKENLTPSQMNNILNKKSGLLGITGRYVDRRDIIKAAENGDEKAKLAIEIECYRLKKYIGAYTAAMGGVDAIAFTAGVGENSPLYREKIIKGLEFMGVQIDPEKNKQAIGGEKEWNISGPYSRVAVFVIPTNEELIFAKEVWALLNDKFKFS